MNLRRFNPRPTTRAALLLATSLVLYLLLRHLPLHPASPSALLPVALFLVAGALAVHQYRHWYRPTQDLLKLIGEIRNGQAPIEEARSLSAGRGTAPLANAIADLLGERRERELKSARIDAELSRRVANRTVALERSLSSLRNQAERDSLTGLFNRRALSDAFPRILHACRDAGADLYILMIDLDNFKQVNDNLGHPTGDALLVDVATLIRSHLREQDYAFRYGGDEFVLLLPALARDAAVSLSVRLTQLGAQLGRTLKVRPTPGLSVGMTSLREHPNAAPADLLKAADDALYVHKSTRRSA